MNTAASWLTPEWMQQGLDALKDSLEATPELKRQMVEFLLETGMWDRTRLTYASALSRFHACLNPAQPDTFRTMHIWALMKRFDRHAFFRAMAEDMGYEVRRKSTDERRMELLQRLADGIDTNNRLMAIAQADIEHLQNVGAEMRAHSAFRNETDMGAF